MNRKAIGSRSRINLQWFLALLVLGSSAKAELSFTDGVDMQRSMGEVGNAVVNGKHYTFGRMWTIKPDQFDDHVREYDPATKKWTIVSSFPSQISTNNHFTAGNSVNGDEVWICGGKNAAYRAHNKVFVFNARTKTWRQGPSLPQRRWSGATAIVGNKLHYVSGYFYSKVDGLTTGEIKKKYAFDNHWVLDLNNEAAGWQNAAAAPKRGHAAVVGLKGKIYLIGGEERHSHDRDRAEVFCYNPANNSWIQVASLPKKRSHAEWATFVHQGKIWSVGGINYSARDVQNEIYTYDPSNNTWSLYGNMPAHITSSLAKPLNGKLHVCGGGHEDWWVEHSGWGGKNVKVHTLPGGGEPEPNLPPVVSISANLTSGFAPLTVSFSATASDSDGIKSYKWTFGDGSGNSANMKNTTYKYTKIGTHTAKLVVTDNLGAKTSKTLKITVEEDVVIPDPEGTIVDDNSSAITYNGWGLDRANKYTKGAHNDTLHWSKTIGAKATLDFEGTWIKLYCKTATNGNTIRVSVDGGSPTDINLNGNNEQQQLVFTKQGLSAGSHTITVECRGAAVHIDYFEFGGDTTDPNPGPSEPIVYNASSFFDSNNLNTKGHVKANSWLGYEVDFENGRDTIKFEVSSGRNGGTIQCRLGGRNGEILGSVYVPNTGGWFNFIDVHCFIGQTVGAQDLYFTFEGGLKTLLDIESFELVSSVDASNSQEAESALLSNAAADSSVAGSSGDNYAVIAKGGFAGWTVNVPETGKYTLVFGYSLMAETNEMELLVNDSFLPSNALFTESEGWSNFSVEVNLKAGENDLVLSNVGNSSIEIDTLSLKATQ
ncbi:MAG: carbohydrate-binding protein [Lentisphaeraceae bacterium]|nr:carbohydrate-binding protein [Lentisphaeraceae bacterium]